MTQRVSHRLQIQAAGIEKVFRRHDLAAQVAGGHFEQNFTRFIVQGPIPGERELVRELQEDMADTLNVPQVQLQRVNGSLYVNVSHPDTPSVNLLELLERLHSLPPSVAVLGWAEDERPVLLNLQAEDTTHILLLGDRSAGKTALLRTCALSLALHNRQSQVQMLFLDPERPGTDATGNGLHPMQYLPHVLTGIVTQLEDIVEVLTFLQEEMEYRAAQAIRLPRIVVFVDHLVALLEEGGATVRKPLHTLLQRGAGSGLHLIMSSRQPQAASLQQLLPGNLLLRLVGHLSDSDQAHAATGIPDSGAEHLLGRGDFLASHGETMVRFQAAYVDQYDLHLCLEQLHRRRPPALLAQPASVRTQLSHNAPQTSHPHTFLFDGEKVVWPD